MNQEIYASFRVVRGNFGIPLESLQGNWASSQVEAGTGVSLELRWVSQGSSLGCDGDLREPLPSCLSGVWHLSSYEGELRIPLKSLQRNCPSSQFMGILGFPLQWQWDQVSQIATGESGLLSH